MEFNAWFTHKYIMHGFLWSLHKDHHHKDHDSWFERNDAFFIFYAVVSMGCFYLWNYEGVWFTLPIGLGILFYGMAYFIVHDIFIHQRFKLLRNTNSLYVPRVVWEPFRIVHGFGQHANKEIVLQAFIKIAKQMKNTICRKWQRNAVQQSTTRLKTGLTSLTPRF